LISEDLQVLGSGSFNIASASKYFGTALTDCDDTGQIVQWTASGSNAGKFSCATGTYSKFKTVTSPIQALDDTGNTADQASTDVDITAETSPTATHALLAVYIEQTAETTDDSWTGHVMPQGDAVADENVVVGVGTLDSGFVGHDASQVIVELNSSQVFSYGLDEIGNGSTIRFQIHVQGYWEPTTLGADLAENYCGNPVVYF